MSNAQRIEIIAGLAMGHATALFDPKIKDATKRQEKRQRALEALEQAITTLAAMASSAEAVAASLEDAFVSAQEDAADLTSDAPEEATSSSG